MWGQVFQGRFENTVDEKGRVSVPTAFRKDMVESESVVLTVSDSCLVGYPTPVWETIIERVKELNPFDPAVIAFKRIFIGCAQTCSLDKAGRILIPSDLRAELAIDRTCLFVGQIDKFELWCPDQWKKMFQNSTDQLPGIYEKLLSYGIHL